MSYQIRIAKHALKEIAQLPRKTGSAITAAIDDLSENPRPNGCKKLKGEQEYLWRIRVGDYRVLYIIEDSIKVVEVRKVGNRKEIYD